ncbi:type II toxin-antitoxin system RelE/ParE family toxin [Rhodohalobacter sulfatireducens]|uniref:Type II toxin-antitoxin system RelE/ParE family toxin n=1 Tax=Rhodohalobacter sulfatireducens TaxID=2911366 RepID=A0ABS9KJY4_9BACT|nr:type II toxin-antitoxin system RelE/ParE family toxin [Rhodohalobacter sulfatireducens]MCG2591148.1 type II toxin-antitoxin system RelE/ParE family toxin [Rhodohalobacter sulfatireducens]
MEIVLTDRFLTRVEECTDYIALDHIPTAITWAEGVFEHCQKLSDLPERGRIVPEFRRPEIRELIHGNYRLVYELKTNQIDMLTIWHTRSRISGPDDPHKVG